MVILVNTQHSDYPLILLYNRIEDFDRPTEPARWWDPPYTNVFGGRDLKDADPGTPPSEGPDPDPAHGSWLGITKSGLVAALINYLEPRSDKVPSRGIAVRDFLRDYEDVVECPTGKRLSRLVEKKALVGLNGYSMLCGALHRGNDNLESLAAITNRYQLQDKDIIPKATRFGMTKYESLGQSYSTLNHPFPVATFGQELLAGVIRHTPTGKKNEELLVENLFALLNTNSIPGDNPHITTQDFRYSIFIPPFCVDIGGEQRQSVSPRQGVRVFNQSLSDATIDHYFSPPTIPVPIRYFGTRQQTVILLCNREGEEGNVTYVERTLYNDSGEPTEIREEFTIPDWGKESHNWP